MRSRGRHDGHSVTEHPSIRTRECYRLDDLEIDVGKLTVHRAGEPVHLPPLSFDLLLALLRAAPDAVSSDALVETVWHGAAIAEETLTQRVALVRKALGDDARAPRYVLSIRGRGYRLLPPVQRLGNPSEEAPAPVRWPYTRWATLILAVVGLGSGAWFWFGTPLRTTGQATTSAEATTQRPTGTELVERAQVYLGRHRAEDNQLAIALLDQALTIDPDHPEALAALSFALAQGVTKFHQPATDARRAEDLARRALGQAPDLAAGHHALGLALDTRGRIRDAIAAYARAHALEPHRTGALASMAYLFDVQGRLAEALQANVEVLEGPATPPYLEIQIGATLHRLGYDGAADVWFERALELRPDNVFAALAFARARLSRGRLDEARRIAETAWTNGIERADLPTLVGLVDLLQGDHEQAEARFQQALAISPSFEDAKLRHTIIAYERGEVAEDELIDWADGRQAASQAGDEWPWLTETLLRTATGQPAAALEALDRAIARGYRDADWLLLDPMLAPLRETPGFVARVERIRQEVAKEREAVLAASWLPHSLLTGSSAGST